MADQWEVFVMDLGELAVERPQRSAEAEPQEDDERREEPAGHAGAIHHVPWSSIISIIERISWVRRERR